MEDSRIVELAIAAGLGRAIEETREDVIAAAREAESLRAAMRVALSPSDDPWPPMQVKPEWHPRIG